MYQSKEGYVSKIFYVPMTFDIGCDRSTFIHKGNLKYYSQRR